MKVLIIQRQISPRKQVFWNDKAKINAASPLSVSLFAPHLFMHACRRKEEGVERISVCGCMPLCFAPHVWELLLVCFCLCSSRTDISFVPGSPCCYSVSPLEAGALLQPRHLQTGSEERRHHAEGGANLSGVWGKTGSPYTNTCKHAPNVSTHTEQKPLLRDKQAAHAFEHWRVGSSSIQHELIITSVWICLERSRYTPSACMCVCLSVCVCARMSDTPPCLCLVLSLFIYLQNTSLSYMLPLPLNPQRPKSKNNTETCHLSLHLRSVVARMACQIFFHSHFYSKLGSLQQDCVGRVVY